MADQPRDPTFNPYNPWGTLADHFTWAVDRVLTPPDKKPQQPAPPTNKPPGYAKGVSKVGQTRMGMLKRK